MKVGIVGAGGIGGYLAAMFAESGADLALIARGAHGAAISAGGLRMKAPEGEVRVRPALVTDNPSTAGPCDLVILAVKAHQLASAIEAARPMLHDGSQALTFQNGVEAPDMVAQAYGRDRALIGVARIFVNISGPGEITLREGARRFTIGDMVGAQTSAGAARAIAAFREAGIDAPDCPDVRADLWMKFLLFNAVSSTTAGARTTLDVVRDTPELWQLFEDLVRETDTVARAMGVRLATDAVQKTLAVAAKIAPGARASTAHDLDEGRALEIDWICGAVARLGAQADVDTPASRVIAALLAPYKAGKP